MEKLLNHYDREYMKMAMLKHEQTFREQVCELHRLYQNQKMLMKDTARSARNSNNRPEARKCLDLERPAEEFDNVTESGGLKCAENIVDDVCDHDLELTLGPRIYCKREVKAAEPALPSDSGPSFSSSSTGSSHIKGTRIDESLMLSQQKWGMEMNNVTSNNQDRLNSPPWLFQALSLNMT